jgi:hypothetical protein
MHMTQTIVINLVSEVNDDELEMGNVWSLPAEALCSSNSIELNEEREVTIRSDAILKKNPEEEKEKDGFKQYLGVFYLEDEEDKEVTMMPTIVPHQNFSPPVEKQSKEHYLVLTMKIPLSPEKEKWINSIINNCKSDNLQVLKEDDETYIQMESMRKLQEGVWLDDAVINFYIRVCLHECDKNCVISMATNNGTSF